MKLLIKEHDKSNKKAKACYICKEKFEDKLAKDQKYCKIRGAAISMGNLKSRVPKEIPMVFHNESNHDF